MYPDSRNCKDGKQYMIDCAGGRMLSYIGPILFIVSGKYYRTVKWGEGRGKRD